MRYLSIPIVLQIVSVAFLVGIGSAIPVSAGGRPSSCWPEPAPVIPDDARTMQDDGTEESVRLVRAFLAEGGVHALQLAPDGQRLVWSSSAGIAISDLAHLRPELPLVIPPAFLGGKLLPELLRLYWSPDGCYVAAHTNQGVIVWESREGAYVGSIALLTDGSFPMAWSPDSRELAVAQGGDLFLWQPVTRQQRVVETDLRAESLAWSPDGAWLALDGHRRDAALIILVDALSGELQMELPGHGGHGGNAGWAATGNVSWSPDGAFLAAGAMDGTLRIWQMPEGRLARRVRTGLTRMLSVRWSPDGAWVAIAGDPTGEVQLWPVDGGARRCN